MASFRLQNRPDKRGFVWTFLTGKQIAYVFSGDRSGQTPARVLGGTTGSLVVDAYTGYNDVTDIDGRTRCGCFSHARRYLFRALEQAPEARDALDMILELFRVERDARLIGLAMCIRHDACKQRLVERLEDAGGAMDQVAEGAACDGNAEPREVLLRTVRRHRVAALADDEVRDQSRTVLRAVEHAQRGFGTRDVLSALTSNNFLDVPSADKVSGHVFPLRGELARADRLRRRATVRAATGTLAHRVLDRFFAQPGGIFGATGLAPTFRLLVVGRLRARLLGSSGRVCRVAAAQLAIDGGDSLGAAPEKTSLVFGDLGQRGSEFCFGRVLGHAQLGDFGASLLQLSSGALSESPPSALVLAWHQRALIMFRCACPSITSAGRSES